jgi:flagellar hook-associated protein 1 FlgK
MAGLFDTFTIAKRGLNVQQSAINTTSHNIANANTVGYSRQRAVAETTTPFGGMSRFDTCSVGQVGTGAEITSIQRIRDYFIDYQVRSESGTSGYYTQRNETLSKVEDIFAEPSDSGIQELVNKFFTSFQEVAKSPDKSDVKTVAIQNASSLANALNYTYNQLEKTCEDSQKLLQANVTDVNSYLNQINELNKQIRGISAVGQTPNDLMDKRDNLLDQLSYKFGIKVDRDSLETINLSSTEYPNSPLVKSNPNDTDYSRLSYVKSATLDETTGDVTVEYYPLGDENANVESFTITGGNQELVDKLNKCKILIGDKDGIVGTTTTTTDPATGKTTTVTTPFTTVSASDLNKKIFQTYEYETDASGTAINSVDNNHIKGEIAANQSIQETLKGYMDSLDRLAAGLAYSVNAIQTGSLDDSTSSQGLNNNLIFVTYDENTKSNTSNDNGITAKSIRINNDLVKDPGKLNCSTTSTSGEGDGKRANAIANINVLKMNLGNLVSGTDLTTMDRETFLNSIGVTGFSDTTCLDLNAGTDGSTVDSYYKTIINNLAVATQEASRQADNQETILANLEDQKAAVSGVSLDEEMTNLIQFQHAYQANAKMISTIDELLDVVINGLKR